MQTLSMKTKISGLFRLFRFELPFTAGICVVLGEILSLGKFPPISTVGLGFLSVFFISAASLIVNDYFDLETDKINAPHRPLPAGLVTEREVILLFITVTALGFVAGGLLGASALVTVVFVWAIGFLYNWRLKKSGLAGNLMVSFSVGMTFIFGGIAAGSPFEKIVWLFAIMTALINLGEEIAADAMDVDGDGRAGSRSLAVKLGQGIALKVSAGIFMLAFLVGGSSFLFGWLDWIYLIPIILFGMIVFYATRKLLNPKTPDRRMYIRWIYLSGLGMLFVFLAIRLLI